MRNALKGEDDAAVKAATGALTSALQEVATKAYQAAGPEPAADMGTDGSAGPDAAGDTAGSGEDEEAVEGEFKEV